MNAMLCWALEASRRKASKRETGGEGESSRACREYRNESCDDAVWGKEQGARVGMNRW